MNFVFAFKLFRYREAILMPVPAPAGGFLFFARPRQLLHALLYLLHPCSRKKRNQKKGRPDAAYLLRSDNLAEGCQKAFPCASGNARLPAAPLVGQISAKMPVLGAAYGTVLR